MYTHYKNYFNPTLNYDSLIDHYYCYLSKKPNHLNSTVEQFVTNCNYYYKIIKVTDKLLILESVFRNGQIDTGKILKEEFKKQFFEGKIIISDNIPTDDDFLFDSPVNFPNYKFNNLDLTREFTVDMINSLLQTEFLNSERSRDEVKNCIQTLCNSIMKKYFNYLDISRSYISDLNKIVVGLRILDGSKYLDSIGYINIRYYKNKISTIKFIPNDWYQSTNKYSWTTLDEVIKTYINLNLEYINSL